MRFGFGVDVGGTTIKIAFFQEDGLMISKWEIPTNTENNGSAILPDVAQAVTDYLHRHAVAPEQVIGIGIGVPGPVDSHGTVNKCINLGWGTVNLHETLSRLTGLDVRAGNDANVAALGECWKGGGQGARNMVLATLGTGIGGGVVSEGRLVCGAHGAGGEIGHIVVNRDETERCPCGNYGCIEQYGSATGVVRMAKRYLAAHDTPSVLRQLPELSCKDVFDAAKAGDEAACAITDQIFDLMGVFLGAVCAVADPEVVVLGGGVSKAGQILVDGITPYFRKYAFHACRTTRITLATLGNDAGVYGAFKLALDAFGG